MVDIDPATLLAHGLTAVDVTNAVNAQNLTVPAGDVKIGSKQYIEATLPLLEYGRASLR